MQHELNTADAQALTSHGCRFVFEGANMPCTAGAARWFEEAGAAFCPGKAVNAGGVAVSGLEMSQDFQGLQWSGEEVRRCCIARRTDASSRAGPAAERRQPCPGHSSPSPAARCSACANRLVH